MCACYRSRNLTQRAIEFIRIEIALVSRINAWRTIWAVHDQPCANSRLTAIALARDTALSQNGAKRRPSIHRKIDLACCTAAAFNTLIMLPAVERMVK